MTSIGRGIQSKAYEKHRIKRSDRLLSSPNLRREALSIYAYVCRLFVVQTRPIIGVDWSDLDARGQHFLIRASMTYEGRSITLYEEVHDRLTKEKPKTHRQFLKVLKALLPIKTKPIIVTGAGFKTPWLDEVVTQGWDYIGRVRRPRKYYDYSLQTWCCISNLFFCANQKPQHLELKHRQSSPITVVSKVIELAGYANRFQANTLRKRRVMSHFYLGKRAVMTRFHISKQEGHRQLTQQNLIMCKFVGIPQT